MSFELICTLQSLGIVLIAAECIYIFVKLRTKQHSFLFLYCLGTLINNIGYLLEITSKSLDAALIGTRMCYFGKVLIPLALFLFVLQLCNAKMPKPLTVTLAGFHFFIFALVLTCKMHTLYYTSIDFVEDGLYPHLVMGHGIFYYVYMVLIILYAVIGLIILLRCLSREKSHEIRVIMGYLGFCTIIQCIGFVLFLTGASSGYDLTSVAYVIVAIIMFVLLLRHSLMDGKDVVREQVAENLDDGIIAADKWGDVFYHNGAALKIYPELDRTYAENVKKLVVERYEDVKKRLEEARVTWEDILSELEAAAESRKDLEKNGRAYMVEVHRIERKGEFNVSIYQMTDVTERNKFEKELENQKNIAENASASKSRFVSVVSHEIRTPMNAIVGMTDLMLADPESLNDKQKKYLNNIKTSGNALVMIVNDILDQSKIEAGKMEIVEAPYNLRETVSDILMIIENRVGSKPIRLESDISPEIPDMILGDGLRIRQILINLMNNSVKFTDEGFVKLSVKLVEQGSKTESGQQFSVHKDGDDGQSHSELGNKRMLLRFSIQDSGQGIKPEDLDKLGKAFSQVDTEKNHGKEGTGLGLSISKNFIRLMGGTLEVSSVYGEGSDFYFSITQGVVDESGNKTEETSDSENKNEPLGRVLIIDDTELNLEVTADMLEAFGVEADTASSGAKGLELAQKNQYELILVDYMMPEMDGVETTKALRKLAEENEAFAYLKDVQIIALTGDLSDETRSKFLSAGADDLVSKPISMDTIKKFV